MIHIYCGDGKGKSTASIGLCVRAAGNDIPVLLVQFLKDDTSGELNVLRGLPQVEIVHSDKFFGFTWNMTEAELKEQAEIFDKMLEKVEAWIDENLGKIDKNDCIKLLVILDEVIAAIDCKLVEESVLFRLMDKYSRDDVEFVLTGRNPSDELKERADYISCIEAVKHPYEKGITARQGVEY